VLIEVADLRGRPLVHPRAALVDDEQRQDMVARHRIGDALDVLSQRRRNVWPALPRQLHALVARRVWRDLVVVEHHREEVPRLPDRLPPVALAYELVDHRTPAAMMSGTRIGLRLPVSTCSIACFVVMLSPPCSLV
jgi:hypothetical protein